MVFTDPDREAAGFALLAAEPEAVPTAAFTLPSREADLPAAVAPLSLSVGGECPTKIYRGLLEHLGRDLTAPH